MSKLSMSNGDDHPEAARKHLDDAYTLIVHNRHDGASYLAGYVVECSLKSVILLGGQNARKYGHDLNKLSAEAINLASIATAQTARYMPLQTPGHGMYAAAIGWTEKLRYRPEAVVTGQDAEAWIQEAENVFSSTVAKMWKDGVL